MTQAWNFGAIEAGASSISGNVNQIHSLLDEGKASLSRLASVWGGSGSDSFNSLMTRWDNTAAELNSKLGNLSGKISEAGQQMARTESNVAARFT